MLRLQEREPDTTRLQYGSFVHRVLEKMYIRLRAQTPELRPEDPLPPMGEQARGDRFSGGYALGGAGLAAALPQRAPGVAPGVSGPRIGAWIQIASSTMSMPAKRP